MHQEHIWGKTLKVKPSDVPKDRDHDTDDAYCFREDGLDFIMTEETIKTLHIDYFSNINRGSALIILIAIFEKHLKDICDSVQHHDKENVMIKLSDIKGKSSVECVAKYLEKVIGIDAGKSNSDERWQNINHLFQIRHKIAHTGMAADLKAAETDWLTKHGHYGLEGGFLLFTLSCIGKYEQLIVAGLTDKYLKPADGDLDSKG